MATTAVVYDVIARDMASKAFRDVAASAKEQQLAVTKAFAEQDAAAKRARSGLIASLKSQENEMRRAAAEAEKYGKSTVFLNSHKAQLDKVAGGLAGIGIAAAVGFGAAAKASMDYNASMARVGAFSDDARSHMDQLRQLSMKVGTSIGFSATQSAQAMEEMVKAGVSSTNMINGGLKGALQLAAAGQIDVSQATEIAAAAMTQFGLAGSQIPHVADLLAAGADKALGGVGDLGEAMKYAGTQSKQYGVSIEDTVGVLADFASHGQLGEMAGAQFAQMLSRLGAPTKKAAAEMKSLGLNVYDSNGSFVNMTTLAGRLSTAFKDLSPAQRNAALQTIFGQRAMRGANILLQSGAKGVQNWIGKVNDQGFAAQTAGRKMDSFAGDLQKLKAAFDNALIGTGNGAQGPLRQVTQGLTSVLTEWNKMPDAAKTAVGDITGSLAVLGLGGAATIKVIQGVAAMRKAFTDLNMSAGAVRNLKTGFGLGGIALIGVTTAIGIYEQRAAQARQDTANFAESFSTMTGKVNLATGALNKNVRASAVSTLQQRGALEAAKNLGLNLGVVTDAVLGNAAAHAKVQAAIDKAKSASHAGEIAAAGYGHAQSVNAIDADKLGKAIGYATDRTKAGLQADRDRRAAMARSKAATDQATRSTIQNTASTQGNVYAQATWRGAEMAATKSATAATKSVKDQEKALKADRAALIASANAALTASGDQIAFKQAIADATKAAKDNKHTLDLNTQAGRDNRTALNNLAGSTLTFIQDLIKNKAGTDKLTSATKQGRAEFIRIAQQMGATRGQAKRLADQYGLVPKSIVTKVTTPGMSYAQRQVAALKSDIDRLNSKTVSVHYKVDTNGHLLRFANNGSSVQYASGGPKAVARAGGGGIDGPVRGPGTSTSDSIVTALSDGEWVTKTAARRYYGDGVMSDINAMRIPREMLHRAGGGPVNRQIKIDTQFPSAGGFGAMLAGVQGAITAMAQPGLKKAATNAIPSFPGLPGGSSGGLQAYARALMAVHGWSAANWPALRALWQGESGWNPRAYNAGSGATGIPQALPGSKMASAGSDWRSNGKTQIRWGEGYIHSVYGSPSNAYSRWLSRSPHWYANGTNNARPGLAIVGENGPEALIMRGGEQVIPHMASGGPVGSSAFGSSSSYSIAAIVRLIQEIANPSGALARFTASVKAATAASQAARRTLAHPHRALIQATSAYTRARARQANLRLANAKQTEHARARVAGASADVKHAQLALQKLEPTNAKIRKAQSALVSAENSLASRRRSDAEAIAKLEDKIRTTKKGTVAYQNLLTEKSLRQRANTRDIASAESKVGAARKAAGKAGVNTDKITAAQRRLTRAENELAAARAHQSKVSRENSLQTAESSAKVAAAEAAKRKATDAYNHVADIAKAKADALRTAQQNLAQEQQAVADSAKQVSDSFTGLYNQPTGSIIDLFQSMNKGAADLKTFSADVDKLRKKGLNESIIDQIMNQAQSGGVASGITLANQALGGGTYLIGILNKSAQRLQDAGDILGYRAATARGNGYAAGTNWASPGIHDVAENRAEVVIGRQARRFKGGEIVKHLSDYMPDTAGHQSDDPELHVHFHGVTDTHAAANEFQRILRNDTRWKGGVKIGLRTRSAA